MNVYSDDRKRKSIAFLATGVLLVVIVFALVQAPQIVRAGGPGPGWSNLTAVASPTPPPHLLWQYDVVVALNPEDCSGQQNGLGFHGNAGVYIGGGGALTYGCLRSDGNEFVIIERPYKPRFAGDCRNGSDFDPPPEWVRNLIHLQVDFTDQAQAACDQLPIYEGVRADRSTEAVIPPGNYSSIIVTDTLTMLPGLYCLAGDFMVYPGATLVGDGVTIYMTGGDFVVNGGEVHLAAPAEGILSDPLWRDLLLYVANDHAANITLAGSTPSNYHGVVYAPSSNIEVFNNAESHIQLIGWNVQIGGTSDVFLIVDFWPGMPKLHPR